MLGETDGEKLADSDNEKLSDAEGEIEGETEALPLIDNETLADGLTLGETDAL